MTIRALAQKAVRKLQYHHLLDWMPDRPYVQLMYWVRMNRRLDLKNPKTFNEKLQWLKLYDRRPEYTILADKVLARDYIAKIVGPEYLIPLLGVWDDPDEIDFDKLPHQFVLKCNHNSGLGMCICKDKSRLDIGKVRSELRKGLKQDYYAATREYPYKNIPRKILCERYMEDGSGELMDYKLMCFNGEVKCSFVCSNRFHPEGLRVTFFDKDWQMLPFERHYPKSDTPIAKPVCYDRMVALAQTLSAGIPFVRVDFYQVSGRPYIGELTFYPGGGTEEFTPEQWDAVLGSWISLPKGTSE